MYLSLHHIFKRALLVAAIFVFLLALPNFLAAQNDKNPSDAELFASAALLVKKFNMNMTLIAEPAEKDNRYFYAENIKKVLFEDEKSTIGDNLSPKEVYPQIETGLYLQKLQDNFSDKFNCSIAEQNTRFDSLQRDKNGGTFLMKSIFYLRGSLKDKNTLLNIKDSCTILFVFKTEKQKLTSLRMKQIRFFKSSEKNAEKEAEVFFGKLKTWTENRDSLTGKPELEQLNKLILPALHEEKTTFTVLNAEGKKTTYLKDVFLHRLEVVKGNTLLLKEAKLSFYYGLHKAVDGLFYYKKTVFKFAADGKKEITEQVEKTDETSQSKAFWTIEEINLREEKK